METAPQIRKSIFKQIHEIVFHGQGGYDYKTIYSMPLWLRKFTFHEIRTFYEEKAAAEKGAKGKINTPQFKKASKPYERKSSYK